MFFHPQIGEAVKVDPTDDGGADCIFSYRNLLGVIFHLEFYWKYCISFTEICLEYILPWEYY